MDHFFEESAANVFVLLVAIDVLVAELKVVEYRAAQTVQSVGKEEFALLQDSRGKYNKVVLRPTLPKYYICEPQISFLFYLFWQIQSSCSSFTNMKKYTDTKPIEQTQNTKHK